MKEKRMKKAKSPEERKSQDLKKDLSKSFKKVQIVAIISFVLALTVIFLSREEGLSIQSITNQAGGNPLKSILTLVFLFAIKSLTVVIPLGSLYLASGLLFPPLEAVLISYLGLAVALSLPYLLGRWAGTEAIAYVRQKYPKIEKIIDLQKKNEFFASFIVRLIGWFPCDILSFYFGACKTPYPTYLLSALLGASIGVITNTLLGDLILDPLSWQFILMVVIKIIISLVALGLTYHLNKGKVNIGEEEDKDTKSS